MKKLLLALGLLVGLAVPATAQNTQCANRPAGDSTNACANTRFVQGAVTSTPIACSQLPAFTGDITKAVGSCVTAIAVGAIVDADVNASAAIAASKLSYTAPGTSPQSLTLQALFNRQPIYLESYCSAALLATSGGDITSCLQNAINALPQKGGSCVILPAMPSTVAFWRISSTIQIGDGSVGVPSNIQGVCLKGAGSAGIYGSRGTYLTWNGAVGGLMVSVNGPIENVSISGINFNGNNIAAKIIEFNSVRWSRLNDVYGQAFTGTGLGLFGLAASANNNIMLDFSYLYFTTNQANAIAFNIDGVLASSTDTWLSTVSNSRFESTGTNGVAIRLGFSDNMLWNQIHAIAIPASSGCGVLFDASTSGMLGNSFPTGHFFNKSAIANTCTIEDGTHTIGVNNFADYGTTDGEVIPSHQKLRGYTDQGQFFNYGTAFGAATAGQVLTYNSSTSQMTFQSPSQLLPLVANASVAAGQTRYFSTGGANGTAGIVGGVATKAGSFRNLYARVNLAPGAGQSFVFTWRVNGLLTPITCTIADAATSCSDVVNTAAISAGQVYEVQIVASASSASTIPNGGIEFVSP